MANDIVVYERAIDTAMPTISNILAATPGLPARSFKAAMLSQMVRSQASAKLLACSMPSFLNCAATFAGLGLMPDGVTGQAFMLPFAGVATPVIGYKGYNTLGDRAGRTITGDVWREGDEIDYRKGSKGFVDHKPMGAAGQRRILGAWAVASATDRTDIVEIMFIEDLEEVRLKAPSGSHSSSPWMDLRTGRPAMYAKTPKRRLGRSLPFIQGRAAGFHVADALEGKFEATNQPHYLLPGQDGQLHITNGLTGEQVDVRPPPPSDGPDPTAPLKVRAQINAGEVSEFEKVSEWKVAMLRVVSLNAQRKRALEGFRTANAAYLAEANSFGGEWTDAAMDVSNEIARALAALQ